MKQVVCPHIFCSVAPPFCMCCVSCALSCAAHWRGRTLTIGHNGVCHCGSSFAGIINKLQSFTAPSVFVCSSHPPSPEPPPPLLLGDLVHCLRTVRNRDFLSVSVQDLRQLASTALFHSRLLRRSGGGIEVKTIQNLCLFKVRQKGITRTIRRPRVGSLF